MIYLQLLWEHYYCTRLRKKSLYFAKRSHVHSTAAKIFIELNIPETEAWTRHHLRRTVYYARKLLKTPLIMEA